MLKPCFQWKQGFRLGLGPTNPAAPPCAVWGAPCRSDAVRVPHWIPRRRIKAAPPRPWNGQTALLFPASQTPLHPFGTRCSARCLPSTVPKNQWAGPVKFRGSDRPQRPHNPNPHQPSLPKPTSLKTGCHSGTIAVAGTAGRAHLVCRTQWACIHGLPRLRPPQTPQRPGTASPPLDRSDPLEKQTGFFLEPFVLEPFWDNRLWRSSLDSRHGKIVWVWQVTHLIPVPF